MPPAGTPCDELWAKLGEAGFIGINIPEEYGGGGAGLTELALVCEETRRRRARRCSCCSSRRHLGRGAHPLRQRAAEARPGCPAWPRAGARWCSRSPSPTPASNTHQLSTTARRDGDEWVLRGTKYYISGVDEADALIVVARTGTDPASGKGRMSLFLVPGGQPGPGRERAAGVRVTAGEAVHAVLRRRAAFRRVADRRPGRGVPPGVPRPEPGTHHRGGYLRRRRPVRPGPRGAGTPPTARCGERRSARTRASRTPWPRPRSRSTWPR